MKRIYTLLYALSILLINPWGASRGAIWTQPKVFILLLVVILNLAILLEAQVDPIKSKKVLQIPRSWWVSLLLWGLFLSIGLFSTLKSPFPLFSLLGQDQMGDGWLYWLLVASFTLTNTLLLQLHPQLLHPQVNGLICGGFILALSIFPQVLNWCVDYTATTGQLLYDNILISTIFQNHQPIGLYSHRGHAAFVLATVGTLTLVAWKWHWFSTKATAIVLCPVILALLFAQTRAAIIAMLLGATYLLGRKYYKLLASAALVCLLVVSSFTVVRQITNVSPANQAASGRVGMAAIALRGIQHRPWLGWGFDGFGIAYPYIHNPSWTPKVVSLDPASFEYRRLNGERKVYPIPSFKAHNWLLDTALSVGLVGLLLYAAIWIYSLHLLFKSPFRDLGAIALVYCIFTLTWFECAQFTHLVWWAMSLWHSQQPFSNCTDTLKT